MAADNQPPDCGFLYVATGRKFLQESINSAQSVRKHMPTVATCCFTDEVESARPYFDIVLPVENPTGTSFDKMGPLARTPFKRTIFVDTDTLFLSSMMDVFDLLFHFEIAAVPDPFWCEYAGIPPCFMHLNTGLVAYQNTPRTKAFFDCWIMEYQREFEEAGRPKDMQDQPSFQKILFYSDLRLYLLPQEYNLRLICPQLVRVWARAKMLHARHHDLADLGDRLNAHNDVRVIWPNYRHFLRGNIFMVGRKQDALLRAWAALPRMLLRLVLR